MIHCHEKTCLTGSTERKHIERLFGNLETHTCRNAAHLFGYHMIKLYLRLFVLSIHTGNFQMCICQIFAVAS